MKNNAQERNPRMIIGLTVLIIVIAVGIIMTTIFCRHYGKSDNAQNVNNTVTSTTAPSVSVAPIVATEPHVTTAPAETTSVSVNGEGTTVYVQTNVPAVTKAPAATKAPSTSRSQKVNDPFEGREPVYTAVSMPSDYNPNDYTMFEDN